MGIHCLEAQYDLREVEGVYANVQSIIGYLEGTENTEVDQAIVSLYGEELKGFYGEVDFSDKTNLIDVLKVSVESVDGKSILKSIWNALVKFLKAIVKYFKSFFTTSKVKKDTAKAESVNKDIKAEKKTTPEDDMVKVPTFREAKVAASDGIKYTYADVKDFTDNLTVNLGKSDKWFNENIQNIDLNNPMFFDGLNKSAHKYGIHIEYNHSLKTVVDKPHLTNAIRPTDTEGKTLAKLGWSDKEIEFIPKLYNAFSEYTKSLNKNLDLMERIIKDHKDDREAIIVCKSKILYFNKLLQLTTQVYTSVSKVIEFIDTHSPS